MTNTLGIMLEILNNHPWTRLSVMIMVVIKRQFFHMVMHVFDNSNLSQEIFPIDSWGAVICSLGHGRKHMLWAWFPLSQLRPRQQPISSQNKAISLKDDCLTFNRFFLCRGRGICHPMGTRL